MRDVDINDHGTIAYCQLYIFLFDLSCMFINDRGVLSDIVYGVCIVWDWFVLSYMIKSIGSISLSTHSVYIDESINQSEMNPRTPGKVNTCERNEPSNLITCYLKV